MLVPGPALLTSRRRTGSLRVDENLDAIYVFRVVALSQTDRLQMSVVELEVLYQILPNHQRLCLRQEFIFLTVALHSGGRRDDRQPERLLLEELSDFSECLAVLQFRLVGIVEEFLRIVRERL